MSGAGAVSGAGEPQVEHHRLTHDGVALHYVTAGLPPGEGTPLVLVHGFPQTWRQWRPVMARLAGRFTLIAPDLRGIGAMPGPPTGYDKHSLADDVRAVVQAVVGEAPAVVVGHDMGSYVAYAYALRYRALTEALAVVDAPMPGTALYDQLKGHPRAWHVAFHQARDVAEMLVAGRERAYIAQFVAARIYDASAVSEADIDAYAAAYSAPGALRAAFEMYRAMEGDVAACRALIAAEGRLAMPVVAVGGDHSLSGPHMADMLAEIAVDGRAVTVERSGHWIPEERPDALAELIVELADAASL